ncbi:MAG TPA: tRNA lysidine(34) synthetase TilS [Steroidobacteraceae bacterium]|jgi:tRNA(Ile)-lysidine synthase|nr:tRNA lysidine(34) synthetase TilS [Steroidobacteraceae bacterium]
MSYSAASLREVLETHAPADATGLVVALSGGKDSASLLSAAASLGATFRGLSVRAIHIDHGLQSAAASFREACAQLCAGFNIPLTVIPVSIRTAAGASIEAAARDARYAALALDLKPGECLLTAHHREDQAETLLLQALRGAGLSGLAAMPACRPLGLGWHLRPVLEVPQDELLAFGAGVSGASVADPMNQDLRFDRGFLRRQVWPLIKLRWPGASTALSRTARHAAEAQGLLDDAAAADVSRLRDGEALSVPGLRVLRAPDRINALRFWLCEAGVEPPSTARLTEALRQILEAKADRVPSIAWGSFALRRYRQRVFLTRACPPRLEGTRHWFPATDSRVDLGPGLGELGWTAHAGGIDPRRLPEILIVRRREGGETLKPAANAKTQSVQHLCQLRGVLPWMRDALPFVFADGALIAVADLWADARWCAPPAQPGFAIMWRQAPIIVY